MLINLYNRIFLKFWISASLLIFSNATYSQTVKNNSFLHDVILSKHSEIFLSLFALLAFVIVAKIIFSLFMDGQPSDNNLKEKIKESLSQSKEALQSIEPDSAFNLMVGNLVVDNLIIEIINKSRQLMSNPDLKEKDRHITVKSLSYYMPRVIDSYKNISPELRDTKADNDKSAHEMTVEQLELIIQGLEKIDLDLLSNKQNKLRNNGNFITTVFFQDQEFKDL